jgi:hypothetical protein
LSPLNVTEDGESEAQARSGGTDGVGGGGARLPGGATMEKTPMEGRERGEELSTRTRTKRVKSRKSEDAVEVVVVVVDDGVWCAGRGSGTGGLGNSTRKN